MLKTWRQQTSLIVIGRVKSLQANISTPVSPKLLTIFMISLKIIATGSRHSAITSSQKRFGKAKAEGDIYVDYEVNQNHGIKEFIKLLKN